MCSLELFLWGLARPTDIGKWRNWFKQAGCNIGRRYLQTLHIFLPIPQFSREILDIRCYRQRDYFAAHDIFRRGGCP
jgi:hypothetical protein